MKQIKSEEFPKIKKMLGDTKNLDVYPYKKSFIKIEPAELNTLYFALSECSQVLVVDKIEDVIIDVVPALDLIKNNFRCFKDAKIQTLNQVAERFDFLIYEDLKELKSRAKRYDLRRKEVEQYLEFCNTFCLSPQRGASINLYFKSIQKKIIN